MAVVAVTTIVVVVIVVVTAVVYRFVTALGKRAGRITGKTTGYYRYTLIVQTRFTRLLRIYARVRVRAASRSHIFVGRQVRRNSEKSLQKCKYSEKIIYLYINIYDSWDNRTCLVGEWSEWEVQKCVHTVDWIFLGYSSDINNGIKRISTDTERSLPQFCQDQFGIFWGQIQLLS